MSTSPSMFVVFSLFCFLEFVRGENVIYSMADTKCFQIPNDLKRLLKFFSTATTNIFIQTLVDWSDYCADPNVRVLVMGALVVGRRKAAINKMWRRRGKFLPKGGKSSSRHIFFFQTTDQNGKVSVTMWNNVVLDNEHQKGFWRESVSPIGNVQEGPSVKGTTARKMSTLDFDEVSRLVCHNVLWPNYLRKSWISLLLPKITIACPMELYMGAMKDGAENSR